MTNDEGDDAIIEHDTSYCSEVGTPLPHTRGRTVIGQFSRPYSSARPAKILSCLCCETVVWFIAKISQLVY